MDKVSIIIPVYNSAIYLSECLNSVKNQNYTNLEVLLIDDGSTDGSDNMLDEFAKTDNRFTVIHIKNGGVSKARNIGLTLATGEYIAFVDSDDFIDNHMIAMLVKNMKYYNIDICSCNGYVHDTASSPRLMFNMQKDILIKNPSDYDILFDSYHKEPWGKLFKRGLLKNFKFNESFRAGEVWAANADIIKRNPKILFLKNTGYHYRITQNSLSTKSTNEYLNDCCRAIFYTWEHTIDINQIIVQKYFVNWLLAVSFKIAIRADIGLLRECISFMRPKKLFIQESVKGNNIEKVSKILLEDVSLQEVINNAHEELDMYKRGLVAFAKSYNTVMIYGCGNFGKEVGEELLLARINFLFVVSSKTTNSQITLNNNIINCMCIEDCNLPRESTGIILAMTEKHKLDVIECLKKMRYSNIFDGNSLGLHLP